MRMPTLARAGWCLLFASLLIAMRVQAAPLFVQTNLVSDIQGFALATDPALRNPWGISFSPTSPIWISDQGANLATLYRVTNGVPVPQALQVTIPQTGGPPQGPTGQVFNSTTAFRLSNGNPATFIFADLNGTIDGWNGGTAAAIEATTAGAVYTGLALATDPTRGPLLYAANGPGNRIDVFDGNFQPVTLPGAFTDPNEPAGFAPFNVQNLGGSIFVTYAPGGRPNQINAALGQGVVAMFDTAGNFQREVVRGGELAAPWGLAIAPAGFDGFGGDLLVGNFSFLHSEINIFDLVTGGLLNTIPIATGPNTPGGLWALAFGNGVTGDRNTLFFTDGINGEANGLFASIRAIPEPGTVALLLAALALLVLRTHRPRLRFG